MKKNNLVFYILIVIGIFMCLIGGCFSINYLTKAGGVIEYADESSLKENRLIYVKGNLETIENAFEMDLDFNADACLLIREVKVVQNYSDENGERLVLANYNIKNPNEELDTVIKSNYFIGKAKINGIELDDSILRSLANCIGYKEYTNLDPVSGNDYDLTFVNNAYVTASDEWNLGDIKVTYKYLSSDDEIEILGRYKDGLLMIDDGYDFSNNSPVGLNEIKSSIRSMAYPYIGIFGAGILIVVSSFILKKKGLIK